MPHITLDDEQAHLIAHATGPVELRDRNSNVVGVVVVGFTPTDIELAEERRRSNQPRYTTAEVLRHLQSLDPSGN